MRRVQIADRLLGDNYQPFVVAEVGINHNGSLETALDMIVVAKEAGCDAVKFATLKADEFCNPDHLISYWHRAELITETELEMFKRTELPAAAWRDIKAECDRQGIIFFSTPQNRSDLDLLLSVGVPAVKVGSDDLTNLTLIESYASVGLPLILSTGMADPWDVRMAAYAARSVPLVICVCTSEYPCPPAHANVARVTSLRELFPTVPVGFSDHTEGALAAVVAAGLGASYFEKHFTLDKTAKGPDHAFSANQAELEIWARSIRNAVTVLGDGEIRPTEQEKFNRVKWRRESGQQIRGSNERHAA